MLYRLHRAIDRAYAKLPWASQRIRVGSYTTLSKERLLNLETAVRMVVRNGVPGDVVECGCAEGGSAALMALWLERLKSPKRVYLFDTFEGLPPPTLDDPEYDKAVGWTGKCRGSLDQVQGLFRDLGVFDRAVFVKGLFQATLPTYDIPPIALLHLDGDWYESTKVCLDHLWDRLSPGGVLQIDDYGAWEGCRKAVDEFIHLRGIKAELKVIDYTGRSLVKPQ
jgi:O-methyltransferase